MCRGEQTLASSTYGRLILRNCRVEQFKRRRSEWIAYEVGKTKKRAVFRDFLDGSLLPPAESTAKPQEKRKREDEQIIEQRDEVELQSFVSASNVAADPVMNDVMAAITNSTVVDKKSKKSKKSKNKDK